MSLDQVEIISKLLRASRNCNELLLRECLKDILENGISSKELNSSDKSGRVKRPPRTFTVLILMLILFYLYEQTALSYVCSTNLTNILDLFLQLPGIDVNKADNEGNTPLHFAAQAGKFITPCPSLYMIYFQDSISGQTEIVNLLLTRCKNIHIDARNNLGFTPLMKAALQGRTRSAKLLLFAGNFNLFHLEAK